MTRFLRSLGSSLVLSSVVLGGSACSSATTSGSGDPDASASGDSGSGATTDGSTTTATDSGASSTDGGQVADGSTTSDAAAGGPGIHWVVDGQSRDDANTAVVARSTGAQNGKKYLDTTIVGAHATQLAGGGYPNVRINFQVASPMTSPVTIAKGSYPCEGGSVTNGTSLVRITLLDAVGANAGSWTASTCTVEFTEEATLGGRFVGRFSGTMTSPAFAGASAMFSGTFALQHVM
ncbi:MAG: hypothetical protein U0169_04495 [Polyangiaceae bacterium]